MSMEEKNIVAIEIGSSKVKGALGQVSDKGVITVQAVEEEPFLEWVRYGEVSNVEEVAATLRRIIERLEMRIAPAVIAEVYVAVGARSLCSTTRSVEHHLVEEMEIGDDILRELQNQVRMAAPADRVLLAVLPREYAVDRKPVTQPKGTLGNSVSMDAVLLTCRKQIKSKLERLLTDKLGLKVAGFIVRQTAIADAVLTHEEKRIGCMLVDFGAETTTVSIYKNGSLQFLQTLPMGSRNITRDLMSLNYLEERAEEIKRRQGNAFGTTIGAMEEAINYDQVNKCVSARAAEIIANIKEQLKQSGFTASQLARGIVVVGRGAFLSGFNDRLAKDTGMNVRSGSVSTAEVRISDVRISPVDSVDVLSIIRAAAKGHTHECLAMPQPEVQPEPEIMDAPVVVEEVVEKVVEPEPAPAPAPAQTARAPRRSPWDRLRGIMDKLEGGLVEDDDDDLRDDRD